jgi:hypothetical protein
MDTFSTSASFEIELPRQIGKLLAEPSKLQLFRHWFKSALWEAESSSSEGILSFAYRVENLIAILDSGKWSEDDFITALCEETAKKFGDDPSIRDAIESVSSSRSRASA